MSDEKINVVKRTYKARLENAGENAEGLETAKVIMSYGGFTVAELFITLRPMSHRTMVIMDKAVFHDQHPALRSALCLLGMEAFLSLHPVTFTPTQMLYDEQLLLEVAGSISLVCEKSEDVPGTYMATDGDHQILMNVMTKHGFELETQ